MCATEIAFTLSRSPTVSQRSLLWLGDFNVPAYCRSIIVKLFCQTDQRNNSVHHPEYFIELFARCSTRPFGRAVGDLLFPFL